MRAEYLLVLALVVASPLYFRRVRRFAFRRNVVPLLKTILIVCVPFWLWDVVATYRGHWTFSPTYTLGITVINMPAEEWLFFVVIAFVSVVTWEAMKRLGEPGK